MYQTLFDERREIEIDTGHGVQLLLQ